MAAPVPPCVHGKPTAMTAFLDFGDRLGGNGVPVTDAEVYEIFSGVAAYLNRPLGITVTTVPPKRRPGEYVTCRFLASRTVPWRESATGNCPRKAFLNTSWYVPNVVYVALMPSAELSASHAAHEIVHCLQPDAVSHEADFVDGLPNLMDVTAPPTGKLSPSMARLVTQQIADLDAGKRIGAHLPPSGGQWTFGPYNIGT